MRRPRRVRLIDPSVAHLDGAGLAGLMPYAQKAALTVAIGTAGPLIDRLSKLPDIPKEHRDAYIKSVLEQTLSPRNLYRLRRRPSWRLAILPSKQLAVRVKRLAPSFGS